VDATVDGVTAWWAYVRGIAPGASQKEIAEAAGVTQPTVSRWAKGEITRASADVAVKIATYYEASVGDALVAAGVLDEHHLPVQTVRIEEPSDDELLNLLAQRLGRDRKEMTGDGDAATTSTADAVRPATQARRWPAHGRLGGEEPQRDVPPRALRAARGGRFEDQDPE